MAVGFNRPVQTEPRMAFLRDLPLFEEIPDATLELLAEEVGFATLQRGERLFWEREPATTFYLVFEGLVKILRETSSGRNVLFEFLHKGEMVGAVAIVAGTPFPATAIAATSPTELITLPAASFLKLLNENVVLYRNYSREIGDRLAEARKWQVQVAYTMESRVAQLLLRLSERMGEQRGSTIILPKVFTRQEIADMVGTTVETAIRILSEWKKSGLLRTEEDYLWIENVQALERLALVA